MRKLTKQKKLLDAIDGIESTEKESAVLQSKIDRLIETLEKQKGVIQSLEDVIDEQKIKIKRMYDVPEDVLELKELAVTQRLTLNKRETDLELAKGELLAIQKEMDFMKRKSIPTQRKLDEGFETIGTLKTELAEKISELLLNKVYLDNLKTGKSNKTMMWAGLKLNNLEESILDVYKRGELSKLQNFKPEVINYVRPYLDKTKELKQRKGLDKFL